ncbi:MULTISPECIES: DUF6482 family protein [Pseudoalteromonas]|uniref:Uncharacterized protein n=1 Tax=Pseudoalteromonas piscicida TaxID=43662 RepID=A0AAQ2ET22_PSEO7|nr:MULTISPECIES: DUF6482 family protein [Pseudoalteromonas]ATD08291.1 hypothetical protein PPIS_a3514 [Pseudoalteromonas piscicida]KJY88674.1 hypothetical protein TW75_11725 [Pseudoalteromonas piscicida]MCO7199986.1 DUF6482 family protein [Pseudoalteromonas sp. OANN1]QUI72584.1 hypothetical protein GSF13_24000 [Pseudoalteromonas sp. M8]TMN35211.1 hypothetical protein CWB94_20985 [Pseudoalteromonas piscicida]
MLAATLKEKIANKELHAIVLSYADSNHYLAGGQDADGNLHILMHAEGKLTPFNSLREAETKLAELGATQAYLRVESAYDEIGPEDASGTHISNMEIRHLAPSDITV